MENKKYTELVDNELNEVSGGHVVGKEEVIARGHGIIITNLEKNAETCNIAIPVGKLEAAKTNTFKKRFMGRSLPGKVADAKVISGLDINVHEFLALNKEK